jgi:hypothetical protein
MSDYTPTMKDVITTYIFLPFALVGAAFGDKEIQQDLLYPFKILTAKIQALTNYLGRVL